MLTGMLVLCGMLRVYYMHVYLDFQRKVVVGMLELCDMLLVRRAGGHIGVGDVSGIDASSIVNFVVFCLTTD